MRAVFAFALITAVGCGDDAGVGEGKVCHFAAECSTGLLCDFGKSPHVCSKMGALPPDMTMLPKGDLGRPGRDLSMSDDMAAADLSANVDQSIPPDLASPPAPDLAPPPPDLAPPPPDLTAPPPDLAGLQD